MFGKKAVTASLIILFLSAFQSYAETTSVSLIIRDNQSDEKVINRKNLFMIRQFIINKGLHETWGNNPICTDNPAYNTKKFSFWLQPNNMFNKSDESDFQTLAIRDPNRRNQYCDIRFDNEFYIDIGIHRPTEELTVSQIRELVFDAMNEILPEIKDIPEPNQHSRQINAYEMQNAIAIATSALREKPSMQSEDYTLTAAQKIIKEKYIWRITFKSTSSLPKEPSKEPIAVGGEIFVKVDLNTKKTEVTYGE
jgi:hypothetical protein